MKWLFSMALIVVLSGCGDNDPKAPGGQDPETETAAEGIAEG